PSRWRDVKGVLAQLLRSERRFESAIEAALGADLQDVLVTDEPACERGVEYLAAHGAGRATFVALDALVSEDRSPAVKALAGEREIRELREDVPRRDAEVQRLVAQRGEAEASQVRAQSDRDHAESTESDVRLATAKLASESERLESDATAWQLRLSDEAA